MVVWNRNIEVKKFEDKLFILNILFVAEWRLLGFIALSRQQQ